MFTRTDDSMKSMYFNCDKGTKVEIIYAPTFDYICTLTSDFKLKNNNIKHITLQKAPYPASPGYGAIILIQNNYILSGALNPRRSIPVSRTLRVTLRSAIYPLFFSSSGSTRIFVE